MRRRLPQTGIVQLVGAGPGDPELITVKGLHCLERADVVIHDRLVSPRLLDLAPKTARRIDVGKQPGHLRWSQRRINTLLVAEARRRRRVVRLKGGDPFVFGRGGEECEALVEAGVPFEIVPGVSSAVAAPAYAGVPVSHRAYSSSFTVVAGHTCGPDSDLDWDLLARMGTLVILMGLGQLEAIVARLVAAGRAPGTPVVIVSRATSADQTVVRGTLGDIAGRAGALVTPATIVVGEVAALSDRIAWFDPTSCFESQRARSRAQEDIVA